MIHSRIANEFLNLISARKFEIESSGKCYLGLSSTKPNMDGTNFTEPTTSDYKRIQMGVSVDGQPAVSNYTSLWSEPTNGRIYNTKEFTSTECKQDGQDGRENGWPEFRYFGLFDQERNGNLIASGALRDPDGVPSEITGLKPKIKLKVGNNQVAVFRVETLVLDFNEIDLGDLDPDPVDDEPDEGAI